MNNFQDLGLNKNILKAVKDLGYETPTPIQQQSIPHILNSVQDLIALAQTGTGKTAAFGIPILNQLEEESRTIQAIVLCPTRELCLQITKDLEDFAKYSNVHVLPVYGGAEIRKQIMELKKNPQIIVGTPGRTKDLINRGNLKINHVQWVVLDEADEMLNMGFRDDIDEILEETPEDKQTLLFSATMPKEVRRIAEEYMIEPVEISIGKSNQASNNVEHHYYMVRAKDRYLALKRIADINPDIYGIIFCRTRRETKEVADALIEDGYNADALHGDLSQAQRDTVMDKFRRKQLQLLVATDVAARGIDVEELTHVINYNLPDETEAYVHRSGRTGRAGNKGVSIIIVHSREGRKLKELEKLISQKIERKMIPDGAEIVAKRLFATIDKIESIEVDEHQIEPYMDIINKKLEWMDRDELLKRFVSLEFNTFLEYYKNAGDLNVSESEIESDGRGRRDRGNSKNFTRFFMSLGRKQKLKAPNLIGLVNDMTGRKDIKIGQIDILDNFSFFEADSQHSDLILKSFLNGEVQVEISKPDKKSSSSSSDGDSRGRRRSGGGGGGGRDRGGKSFGGSRERSGRGGGFSSSRKPKGGPNKSGRGRKK